MKIHCIESKKESFDKYTLDEISKMVGWIEPPDKDGKTWDVVMADGSGFMCKNQETAMILAGIEEVKALLIENKLS